MNFAPLNDALMVGFGEAVTLTSAGTAYPITAAYQAPWQGVTLGHVPIEIEEPELLCRSADLPAGLKRGDTVTRSGVTYSIVDIQPDDAGMTTLKLRDY